MNAFLSDATTRWLLMELARTTLLVAILGGACWLLLRISRASSPMLHRACCLAVLLAGWTVVRWPVEVAWYDAPVIEQARVQPDQDQAPNRLTPPIDPARLSPPPEFGAGAPLSAPMEALPAAPLEVVQPAVRAQSVAEAEPLPTLNFAWQHGMLSIWLAGIIAVVSVWLIGYLRFLKQLPGGLECPPEWQAEFAAVAQEQGRAARVEFRLTDDLGPLLCRSPRLTVLLVPSSLWSELAAAERRAILRHELAHLQRGDLWKSLAVRVLALPHWFNPVAWLAVRRFDDAAEWACDRAAMGEEPTTYAAMLLRLGELAGARARFGSAMSNRPLKTRIRRLLTLTGTEDSAMKKACLMSLLLLVLPLALVRVNLVAEEPKQPAADVSPQRPVNEPELSAPAEDAAGKTAPPAADLAPAVAEQPDTPVKSAQRKMVETAKMAYLANDAAYKHGTILVSELFHWSNLWLSAELQIAESREEQIAAAQRNLARLKTVEARIRPLFESGSRGGEANSMYAASYYVADAERRLAEIEAQPVPIGELETPAVDREMVEAAKKAFEATKHAYETGHSILETHLPWSARWLAAELTVARSQEEQLAAARAHVERMQQLRDRIARLQKSRSRGGEATQLEAANYHLTEAKQRLAEIARHEKRLGIQSPPTSTGIPSASSSTSQSFASPSPPGGLVQPPVSAAPVVSPYSISHPPGKVKLGGKEYFVDDPELNKAIGLALESETPAGVLEAVNAVRRYGLSLKGSVTEVISTGFAAQLTKLLGHPNPQVRDRAEAVLWTSIGSSAPEVKQAAESDNPEIAKRAKRLIEHTGPIVEAEKARSYGSLVVPLTSPGESRPTPKFVFDPYANKSLNPTASIPSIPTEARPTTPSTNRRSREFREGMPTLAEESQLQYDGKTFDQWRTQLTTDLSPTLPREAINAIGEFAPHGYGQEAAAALFDTMRDYSVWTLGEISPKGALSTAAIVSALKIPTADRLPAIRAALKSGNKNQKLFALRVVPFDAPKADIVPALAAATGDPDREIVELARAPLAIIDHDNSDLEASVLRGLRSENLDDVHNAVWVARGCPIAMPGGDAIVSRPFPELLPTALSLLDHTDPDIRKRAIEALSGSVVGPSQAEYVEALEKIARSGTIDGEHAREILDRLKPAIDVPR